MTAACLGRHGPSERGPAAVRRSFSGSYEQVYSAFLQKLVADTPGYVVTRGDRTLFAVNDLTGMRFEFYFRPGSSKDETLVEAVASSRSWTDKEAVEAARDALNGLGLWLLPELRANLRQSENAVQAGGGLPAVSPEDRPARVLPLDPSDVGRPRYRVGERNDSFAVVVGIGGYSDLPEARFAETDAEAVQDHLLALGFPRRNVVLLEGPKALRSAMEKYLDTWLPGHAGPGSRVFFYFAGHGATDAQDGRTYLMPWDGDAEFVGNTGYPIERLYRKLEAVRAREVLVMLDACFSGAGGRSVSARGARPLVARMDAGTPPGGNMVLLAAAEGNQVTGVREEAGHGLFTYFLLKGLNGEAADPAGRVTASGLFGYLKPRVEDAARRQSRNQTPVMRGPASPGEFLLRQGP